MAVGTHGWLVFLCESEKGGTVYKARLHNLQDIQKLVECVKGDRIRCKNGLIYCYGISSVWFTRSKINTVQNLLLEALNQKRHVLENGKPLRRWHCSIWEGSLADLLKEHHEKISTARSRRKLRLILQW